MKMEFNRRIISRKSLCLLLVGAAFQPVANAGDGFIKQPRLKAAEAGTTTGPSTPTVVTQPVQQPAVAAPPVAEAIPSPPAGNESNSAWQSDSLRWVKRGTARIQAAGRSRNTENSSHITTQNTTRPLTQENEFYSSIPTVSSSAVRATVAPSQNVPHQNVAGNTQGNRAPTEKPGGSGAVDTSTRDEATKNPPAEMAPRAVASANSWSEAAQARKFEARAQLASAVSSQIIAQRPVDVNPRPIMPIDAPPGWQSVGEKLSASMANCEALLKRNASYSAREEAEQGMLFLVRVLDQLDNRYHSEPAWLAAQQAMQEAEDFSGSQRLASDRSLLQRIVNSHQTPVLHQAELSQLAPMTAAQHYRLYALQSLIEASQNHPWASELFYAIGRTYQAQADLGGQHADSLRWRATTFYRAAHAVDPNNSLASNQLGFVMLQMDRPIDAQRALVAAVNAGGSAASWQNLVEASRRLGDGRTMQWATQNLVALQQRLPPQPAAPPVLEVDAGTFAAMSPYASGPSPSSPGAVRTASGVSN